MHRQFKNTIIIYLFSCFERFFFGLVFLLYSLYKLKVAPSVCTGKCLKPEQFLKAEHLLKHAFPYRDRSFYGPDR